MVRTVLLVFFLIIICNAQTRRYALIVGQNNGGSSVNELKYAERDAQRISTVLREFGDFQKENSIILLAPDSSKLDEQLKKMARKIKERGEQNDALFLFYFSGHADVNSLLLGSKKYSLEKLQGVISQFPAAFRIAIFDACQSGAVTAYKGGKRAEPFYLQNSGSLVKGQVIIASASARERAQESGTLKGSIFTFHLINGLYGSADVSSDNKVTLNEAYQYAYRKTIETSALSTGEIQHPVYRFNITGQGEIVLSNLNKSESGIVIDNTCEGKFLVLSEDYLEVFADFFKERDKSAYIALRNGSYTIINANGKDVSTSMFSLRKNDVFHISQSMFVPNTITESRIKGSTQSGSMTKIKKNGGFAFSHTPGVGIGFLLRPHLASSDWEQNLNVLLTNDLFIKQKLSLFLDLHANIFDKTAGFTGGIDFRKYNGNVDLFVGAGLGMEYTFNNFLKLKDAFTPCVLMHAGFINSIGKKTKLKVQVPLILSFPEKTEFRTGVDISIMLNLN